MNARKLYHQNFKRTFEMLQCEELPYNSTMSISIQHMQPCDDYAIMRGDYCELHYEDNFAFGELITRFKHQSGEWLVIYIRYVSNSILFKDLPSENIQIRPLGFSEPPNFMKFFYSYKNDFVMKYVGMPLIEKSLIDSIQSTPCRDELEIGDLCEVSECWRVEEEDQKSILCQTFEVFIGRIYQKKHLEDSIRYSVVSIAQIECDQENYFNWWTPIRPIGTTKGTIVKYKAINLHLFKSKNHNEYVRNEIHQSNVDTLVVQFQETDIHKNLVYSNWMSILVCDLKPHDFCEAKLNNNKFYWARYLSYSKRSKQYYVQIVKTNNLSYYMQTSTIRSFGILVDGTLSKETLTGFEIVKLI